MPVAAEQLAATTKGTAPSTQAAATTLWFQLEDTVLLIGTLPLFDPVLFPIYEA